MRLLLPLAFLAAADWKGNRESAFAIPCVGSYICQTGTSPVAGSGVRKSACLQEPTSCSRYENALGTGRHVGNHPWAHPQRTSSVG